MRRLLSALLVVALPVELAAQVPLPKADAPAVKLSGELGTFGELYGRSGAPDRRPGQTGRLYLDANALLFGSLNVGIDLIATTEDGTSLGYSGLPGRQSIGALGLHPRWAWGRGHLGTFSESYSPYTLNGVQLRGAAFDIQPGKLLSVAAFGGRAASPVSGGAVNGSFRRTIAGGKLGVGRESYGRPSSFASLTFLRAWDDPNSMPPVDTTLPPNAPLPGGAALVNPYAVTPEENVVLAMTGGLSFLAGKLALRGELAGAAHSRDVRASELDSAAADVPGALRGLITPRVGTHADYALSSEVQLRQVALPGSTPRSPRLLTATLGFRHVGPGYTTLGAASLGNDLQAIDGRATLRFTRWNAQLQLGTQHDNLVGQKSWTTTRNRLGTTVALRISRSWNATLRANLLTMDNGARADSLQWMSYSNWTLGMGHSFSFGPRKRFESLSFDGYVTEAGDANRLRASTGFSALSANARLAIRVAPALQVSPALGFTHSQSDTLAATTRATWNVSAAWRLWNGRLAATGTVGRSNYARTNAWMAVVGSTFRASSRDDVILNLQYNRYRDTAASANGYDEQIFNVRWARRL